MHSSVNARLVDFTSDTMRVELSDGRTLAVPLAWFPRLLHSTPEQRERVRITSRGLHWDALDEDISIDGLLAGLSDQSATTPKSAAPEATFFLAGFASGITLDDRCASFAVYDRTMWVIRPDDMAILPRSSVR
jgi:hypothetical protein